MRTPFRITFFFATFSLVVGGSFLVALPSQAHTHQGALSCHTQNICAPVTWLAEKRNPQELLPKKVIPVRRVVVPARPAGKIGAYTAVKGKVKNPNSIRIPLALAPPILSETKRVNGKPSCKHGHDKPIKSKKNHKGKVHVDEQCCLDPDEIPNPRCYYGP